MYFDSWTFLVFSLVVFPLYWGLAHRGQNLMLLGASYLFYGAWDARFLVLILVSTGIDYWVGRSMSGAAPGKRRILLLVSCVANLGILGTFKYFDFFAAGAASAMAQLGYPIDGVSLNVVLPVGISFYTFQSMSYTVDVYRGQLQPVRSLPDFALFVAFFPQLVAGPIERASHMLPQLQTPRSVAPEAVRTGLWLVLVGLFQKAVLADNVGLLVDEAFAVGAEPSGATALFAVYGFALQIYCDFAGYSSMARGLARLMGIELMVNFRRPYMARTPQEFWQRWHISLSTWLRDYLYIPMGGSRGTAIRTCRNLMLTMVLGGLWHGAAWTFVWWGVFHGVVLGVHRTMGRVWKPSEATLLSWVQRLVMFHLVCFGWLLFRAEGMAQVQELLLAIAMDFTVDRGTGRLVFAVLFLGVLLAGVESLGSLGEDPIAIPGWSGALGPAVVGMLLALVLLLAPAGERAFLYFQF